MPDPRQWSDLSAAQRREVEALAKQGKRHPSRTVAAVAYEWAVGERGVGVGIAMGLGVMVDGVMGNAGGAGKSVAAWRLAGRLVKLGPPADR